MLDQLSDYGGAATGPKVFTLQTLPAVVEDDRYAQVAKEAGFSLHAGVSVQAWELDNLGKVVSLHIATCRIGKTPITDIRWQHSLQA